MSSSLATIHSRLKTVIAAVSGVAVCEDWPDDPKAWEAQFGATASRLPAIHLQTSTIASDTVTTDGDVRDKVEVSLTALVAHSGSGKARLQALRDAVVSAVLTDATLASLTDLIEVVGSKAGEQDEKYQRLEIQFALSASWSP